MPRNQPLLCIGGRGIYGVVRCGLDQDLLARARAAHLTYMARGRASVISNYTVELESGMAHRGNAPGDSFGLVECDL